MVNVNVQVDINPVYNNGYGLRVKLLHHAHLETHGQSPRNFNSLNLATRQAIKVILCQFFGFLNQNESKQTNLNHFQIN